MIFQKAPGGKIEIPSRFTAIERRGEPFHQMQLRVACMAYGFNPRDGRMPVGRKIPKQKS
jgi:hypothetical protein